MIWKDIRNVRVETETVYGSGTTVVMVGHYLWGTLQAYIVIWGMIFADPILPESRGGPKHQYLFVWEQGTTGGIFVIKANGVGKNQKPELDGEDLQRAAV